MAIQTAKKIFKYPIGLYDFQDVTMHDGAWIIHAGYQGDQLCLWAIVDTNADYASKRIHILGTGHSMPKGIMLRHLSTIQSDIFVWHIFEEMEDEV